MPASPRTCTGSAVPSPWCAGRIDRLAGPATTAHDLQALKRLALDRAVAALVRAVDSGLRDASRLKQDADLAPVRDNVGFRQLMQRLAGADPAPKPAANHTSVK